MAREKFAKTCCLVLSRTKPVASRSTSSAVIATRFATRQAHNRSCALPAASSGLRPRLQPVHNPRVTAGGFAVGNRRTIFIQTESTPNPDALKFLPNHRVLPPGVSAPFVEYLNPRSTIAPPYPSPLAAKLMSIDGVTSVFYGADFITVTKAADANWAHIRPEIFSIITEAITSGQSIINVTESKGDAAGQETAEQDSLSYNETDSEVVGMIKELLETRIRPAIQEDGGDIEYRGFEDGNVLLKLRGACRTCDSSTVTLKNGIEGMLTHYIEEVKGVIQVMDQEEEIALQEFARFEERLRAQKGDEAVSPATRGKGTLDTVPG